MKYVKYILEYLSTKDIAIRDKYYSDIPLDVYEKILSINPKKRFYKDWLIGLYINKKLRLEDLYKAEKYLMIFDRSNVRKKLGVLELSDMKTLPDLYNAVRPYMTLDNFDVDDAVDVRERCLVEEFEGYDLYIPQNMQDAILLGTNTEWCTSDPKLENNRYDYYTMDGGKLFILASKNDDSLYQLSIPNMEFADKEDRMLSDASFVGFFNNNEDVYKYILHVIKTEYNELLYPFYVLLGQKNKIQLKYIKDNFLVNSVYIYGNNIWYFYEGNQMRLYYALLKSGGFLKHITRSIWDVGDDDSFISQLPNATKDFGKESNLPYSKISDESKKYLTNCVIDFFKNKPNGLFEYFRNDED